MDRVRCILFCCLKLTNFELSSYLQKSLYTLFKADPKLLELKGPYLIRQLSVYMGPEDIYQSMADAIANEKDIKFARKLVEQLNAIMFTAAEVSSLREQIKHLSTPVSSSCILVATGRYGDTGMSPIY